MILFILFTLLINNVLTTQLKLIPQSGPSPPRMIMASLAFDPSKEQILIFGGALDQYSQILSNLWYFNIKSLVWGEYFPQSYLIPPGLYSSLVFIGKDEKLYVLFGKKKDSISSDLFSFNFLSLSWELGKLNGDFMQPTFDSASCQFIYNNQSFLAVFGGLTLNQPSENLYLVNTQSLQVTKLSQSGDLPGKSFGASLCYSEGNLYLSSTLLEDYINNTLYKYNLETQKWIKIESDPPYPGLKSSYTLILNNTFFSFFGFNSEISESIQKYSFNDQQWSSVPNPYSVINSAYIFIDSTLYVLFGSSTQNYENSILTYSILNNEILPQTLMNSTDYPKKRKNHACFVLDNKIYVFGGLAEDNSYLNDMWAFDAETNLWTELKVTGVVPKGRELMAYSISSNGNGVKIFGGRDENEIFNDFYQFNTRLNHWEDLTTGAIKEYSRYGSYMFSVNYKQIIMGGKDFNQVYTDVLVYDLFTDSFIQLNTKLSNLINFECVFRLGDNNKTVEIYIYGGTSSNNTPNKENYLIKLEGIFDDIYSILTKRILPNLALPSEATALIDKHKIYIIGGTFYGYQMNKNIFVIDLNGEYSYYKIEKNIGIFAHRAVQLGNKFFVFGGCFSDNYNKISYVGTNSLYEVVFDDNESVELSCSNGNFTDEGCVPCGYGYYYEDGLCLPCPKGTYLKIKGALSLSMCIPCPFGSFSKYPASTLCLNCPTGSYCPIGSFRMQDLIPSWPDSSTQPSQLETQTDKITTLFYYMLYLGFSLLFTLIILLVWFPSIQSLLKELDFFFDKHSRHLNEPVIYEKTIIGGICSLFFALFVIFGVTTTVLSYAIDNVHESKSLIPRTVLEEDIKAALFKLKIVFYEYGGTCIEQGECDRYSNFSQQNLKFDHKTVKCSFFEGNCQVLIEYFGLVLNTDSQIFVHMKEFRAFANAISVEIKVTSSVPNKESSIYLQIRPKDKKTSFKGVTASIIQCEMIPSVWFIKIFYSKEDQLPQIETGFHIIDLKNHVLGSAVSQKEITTSIYLLLEVDLKLSKTGFIINRELNWTFFTFMSILIGSFFGFMEVFAVLMGFIENYYEKIKLRMNKRLFFDEIKDFRIHMKNIISDKDQLKEPDDAEKNWYEKTSTES